MMTRAQIFIHFIDWLSSRESCLHERKLEGTTKWRNHAKAPTLNTSHVAENGRTAKPTSKSATAKLTMKKLVTLRSLWEQNTAAITKQLPTITNTLINARTASDTKFPGSVHFTESMSVQLLIARTKPELVLWFYTTWFMKMTRENTQRAKWKSDKW